MKTRWPQILVFLLLAAALPALCLRTLAPRHKPAPHWRLQPAQPFNPILFPGTRLGGRQYLNGDWSFRLDAKDAPRIVRVPHTWNTMPGMETYEGRATYACAFKVPKTWDGRRVMLHFEGVAWEADVAVNGQTMGRVNDGFLPAAVDITDAVRFSGANRLEVTVSNAAPPRGAAPGRTLLNWGGLFREVYLEPLPEARVDTIRVTGLELLNQAAAVQFSFSVALPRSAEEDAPEYVLYTNLVDPAGALVDTFTQPVVQDPGGDTPPLTWAVAFDDPALWTLDHPDLYSVQTKLSLTQRDQDGEVTGMETVDETFLTFGVRTFALDGARFLFNEEPIYLRGVDRAEDLGPDWGPVQNLADIEHDVALARAAGFNTIRTLFYPPHPGFLDVCDRSGLFVVEDLPLENLTRDELLDDTMRARARNLLRAMIRRDAHHPSILMWGLGAGLDTATDAGREFVADLRALADELDPTRPVYLAPARGGADPGADTSPAALRTGDLDAWPRADHIGPALDALVAASPERPALVFGLGARGRLGDTAGAGRFGSEQNQLLALARTRLLVDERAPLDGDFIHALADFPLPGRGALNPAGVLSRDRKRKTVFFWLSDYATQAPTQLPAVKHAALPVAPPLMPGLAAALLAFVSLAVWSGFGLGRIMLSDPGLTAPDPPPGTHSDWLAGLLALGLPSVLISIPAGAAFLDAAIQWLTPLAPALPPAPAALFAALPDSLPGLLALSAAFQIAGLLGSGALAAVFLKATPSAASGLLARCLFPRVFLFAALLVPWPGPLLAALPLLWELSLRARALAAFTDRDAPVWAVAALPAVLIACAGLAATLLPL